jgi:hypothetical protein
MHLKKKIEMLMKSIEPKFDTNLISPLLIRLADQGITLKE